MAKKGGFFSWLFSKIRAFFGFGEKVKADSPERNLELEKAVEEAERGDDFNQNNPSTFVVKKVEDEGKREVPESQPKEKENNSEIREPAERENNE